MGANSFTVVEYLDDGRAYMKIRKKIVVMNPNRIHRLSFEPFHIRIYPHDGQITLFSGADWVPVRFPKNCMYIDVLSKHRIVRQNRGQLVFFRRLKLREFLRNRF